MQWLCCRKTSRLPFQSGEVKVQRVKLELVHSDLMGTLKFKTIAGERYVLTLVDDSTRRGWIYLLKQKGDTLKSFKDWKALVENQTQSSVKILRTDNGGEYISKEFETFLKKKGITHELTVPYSPQKNGVAERFNRTLIEMARSMMHGKDVPKHLWGEAK